MKKADKKIKISCIGGNATDVSGSMTLIEFGDTKILIEAGIYQSGNIKNDYLINSRNFSFKPSEIDYIIIGHIHADHTLLLPRLYAMGCKAPIIAPKDSARILNHMMLDGAKINTRDAHHLSKMYNKQYKPLYDENDVDNTISHIEEFPFNEEIQINKHIKIEFIPSGHIIQSAQISLTINFANCIKKILYTSDLGNIAFPKYYTLPFKASRKQYDIVFGESTYGNQKSKLTKKHRKNDLNTLKYAIDTTIANNGKVIIPVFSLDRAQNMVTYIYELYKNNPEFQAKVYVDSPLACKITNEYAKILSGEQYEIYEELMNWENLKFIDSYHVHQSLLESNEPMVVLAAPGFANLGRSQNYIEKCVSSSQNSIIFCGYAPENSVAGKLKQKNSTITLNKIRYKIKAAIFTLETFSSHMQKAELLEYYSSLKCNTLVLLHGSKEAKESLAYDLIPLLENKNKSTKVVAADKNRQFYI